MHLRRLVAKGFKSFADRTVIDFSPGISVIVGPNGSGKSNVVDAIAWVLGERGARALRGGSMEDVIFAGTPRRQPLGRAEVELTIDNTDGALPIDFTEVTLRRTLFRTGESEYAINGTPCRLLDITELLSDTGIGRELHTLVGQGHLDDILAGSPAERRAVIEEAAGLLKHRKRKEKALRKLERVDADLERLGDLVGELKRQIRPLERQAELAKRAEALTADLTELRLKLWVLDYRAVIGEDDASAAAQAVSDVDRLSREASGLDERLASAEERLTLAQQDAESLLSFELKLQGLLDRYRSLAALAGERAQRLSDRAARAPTDTGPDEETIAAAVAESEAATAARVEAAAVHARLLAARDEARAVRDQIERDAAERRRLEAERDARRAAIARIDEEVAALVPAHSAASADRQVAERATIELRAKLAALEPKEIELADRSEELESLLARVREESGVSAEAARAAERAHAALEARRAVLGEELDRLRDPAAIALGLPGIDGRVLDALEIEPGSEPAVRAALGALAEAVLVSNLQDAGAALAAWREAGARGVLVLADALQTSGPLAEGSVAQHVRARSQDGVRLAAHLATVALVDDLTAAGEILRRDPARIVVTRDGDRIDAGIVTGGALPLHRDLHAEIREIDARLVELAAERDAAERDVAAARRRVSAVEADVAVVDEQLNALDADREALLVELDRASRALDAAEAELVRIDTRSTEHAARRAQERDRIAQLDEALAAAPEAPALDPAVLIGLEADVAEAARALGERTERERAAIAHVTALRARAERAARERDAYERGRESWERGAARCAAVADRAGIVAGLVEGWAAEASSARSGGEERRTALTAEVAELRHRRREVEAALANARDRAHTAELRASDRRHRITSLEEACRERLGMEPAEALEATNPSPEDREDFEQQARGLERKLGLLGRVNPIAMEQYDELVERHRFLTEQVEDLRTSRRELLGVVTEVDRSIVEIFGTAFADIAREFEAIFERVFPGGEGRLTLTDPENLLETGIEVEARPAGKRVKRVSLLSGGERSLVALALLFAVFKARPSPFYILDEVEAALDDVNLHRLLGVIRDFRDAAQLLVVTHQKRTMEIADVLYGISMAEAGVTQVLSERLDRIPESV